MKTSDLLVMLAVVLVVVGSGLSYSGYNESLQIATSTNTKSVTHTSTRTVAARTTTESIVVATSSTHWILQRSNEHLGGIGEFGGPTKTCGVHLDFSATLELGPVHVSFKSVGGPVDFFMFDKDHWMMYKQIGSCTHSAGAMVMQSSSSEYEFSKDIKSAGDYYFLFENHNLGSVSITLNVDAGVEHIENTETIVYTLYSTIETPLVLETLSLELHPAPLGMTFFFGIPVAVTGIGIVAFLLSRRRRLQPARPAVPSVQPTLPVEGPETPITRPPLEQAPPPPTSHPPRPTAESEVRYCRHCGAAISPTVNFCTECGRRVR